MFDYLAVLRKKIKKFLRKILKGNFKKAMRLINNTPLENDRITDPAFPTSKPRVLIITQSKAGTYLYVELMREFGIRPTYLHLGRCSLQAYEPSKLDLAFNNPRLFDAQISALQAAVLIREGEVAATHMWPATDVVHAYRGFKKIVVTRELRSALKSYANMILQTENRRRYWKNALSRPGGFADFIHGFGPNLCEEAAGIATWAKECECLHFKKEDFDADPLHLIKQLGVWILDEPLNFEVEKINEALKAKKTLTHSQKQPGVVWGHNEEKAFNAIGGPKINKMLGYE